MENKSEIIGVDIKTMMKMIEESIDLHKAMLKLDRKSLVRLKRRLKRLEK